MSATHINAPAWAGWFRAHRAHPWRKLVEAVSETAAWDWLLAHGPHGREHTDDPDNR